MTFTTKNTANQIYLWALSRAIRAGLYTLANTASSDSDVATGKLVKAGTFAANDVLRWGAEAMVTANLYTKDDVFVAYLQVKNTASLDNETKTTTFVNAMRDASQTEGKLARYGTEAFVGHMQMSHTTAGAKITAQCDKFDAVFTDLGEFLKNSENFNLSDMGYLAEMAGRYTAQQGKWANAAATCDSTCLALTSTQPFLAIKSIDSRSETSVAKVIAAKVIADYKLQKAQEKATATTNISDEGAYNYFGYTTETWKLVDWNKTTVAALFQSARAKADRSIIYKDDMSFTNMKLRDLSTALTFAGLKAADGLTNAELWFLFYVTADAVNNITAYDASTTGFFTSAETADIDMAVGTHFPSYYFTEKTVNAKAYTRDLVNDVLFVAKKFKLLNSDQSSNAVYKNMTAGQTYMTQPLSGTINKYDNGYHAFKLAEDYCF